MLYLFSIAVSFILLKQSTVRNRFVLHKDATRMCTHPHPTPIHFLLLWLHSDSELPLLEVLILDPLRDVDVNFGKLQNYPLPLHQTLTEPAHHLMI